MLQYAEQNKLAPRKWIHINGISIYDMELFLSLNVQKIIIYKCKCPIDICATLCLGRVIIYIDLMISYDKYLADTNKIFKVENL